MDYSKLNAALSGAVEDAREEGGGAFLVLVHVDGDVETKEVSEKDLDKLSTDPRVQFIELSRVLRPLAAPSSRVA